MTLQEVYAALGGDYEDVTRRMFGEKMTVKFMLKFPCDKSYGLLCSSLEGEDYETAFRAVHSLKGVCRNLGFTRLYRSSSMLADALRQEALCKKELLDVLFAKIKRDYEENVSVILKYEKEI